MNKDYLKLLGLIENKKKISGSNFVDFSLEEIAITWNKKSVLEEDSHTMAGTIKPLDKEFLSDTISALRKLEEGKLIKFRFFMRKDYKPNIELGSISEILHSTFIGDKIYLEVKGKATKKKRIIGSARFTENPPQIIFGSIKIPIPPDSKQLCVCRIMFNRGKGETVCWDEIAIEIDGGKCNSGKETNWRGVYDAVLTINKKVKRKIGKKLFQTSRKSFHRIM